MVSSSKLLYGVGINDADYVISKKEKIGGKWKITWRCPFYTRWAEMLRRGYSERFHERYPTYKDCVVTKSWLTFSNFKSWMLLQDWENKHLDKDLLLEGNKIYCPSVCIFVDQRVNLFINERLNCRGEYLLGVSWYKNGQKFCAKCKNPFNTKGSSHIGYFSNEMEAHMAWRRKKHEYSSMLVNSEYVTDSRLRKVLLEKYL